MASWTWDSTARRYRAAGTGRFLSPSTNAALRDHFAATQRSAMAQLARDFGSGSLSLEQFEQQFRERIRLAWTTEYAFGRGGRAAMTSEDQRVLGELVRAQWQYLNGFARDVATGALSAAQIEARAQLYANATVTAYERGRAAAFDGLTLPAHPGDGSSECLVNCRCTWQIVEKVDQWEATWVRSAAESCDTCIRRSRTWNPLGLPRVRESLRVVA